MDKIDPMEKIHPKELLLMKLLVNNYEKNSNDKLFKMVWFFSPGGIGKTTIINMF